MDDLEEVRQQFIADVGAYVEDVQMAAGEAREFADSARAAKDEADNLRDGLSEAAYAAGVYRDEMGRLRDASGRFVSAAEAAALEMGHVRDEAAEAAASVRELGTQAEETAGKLDLMGLSGLGTFSSLGPLLGIIGAIVIAAAAVAPAVAGMGLGFGAFGAFAIPTLMQVTSGIQQVTAAQAVLTSATSTSKQRATALTQEKQVWASMPAPIADVVKGVLALKAQWQQLSQAFQPEVLSAVDTALGIAGDLMKEIVPLAVQGGYAINGMLEQIKAGIDSSGFKEFLATMTRLVVPATQAIMHLAFTILGILGQALEQLAPLSIPFVDFLSVLIGALGGPVVAALHVIISLFLGLATAIEPLLPGLSQIATLLINDIGSSFAGFIPIIQQVVQLLGGAFLQILQDLLPVIANALTQNSPFMYALSLLPGLLRAVLPAITAVAGLLKNPMFAQLAVDVLSFVTAGKAVIGILGMLRPAFMLLGLTIEATPIGWIITAIAGLVFVFIELWNHCAAFRQFWEQLWAKLQAAVGPVLAAIKAEIAIFTSWWNAHWKEISEILHVALILMTAWARIQMTLLTAVIRTAMTVLSAYWRIEWGLMRDTLVMAWDLIKITVRTATKVILDTIAVILDLLTGHWSKAWADLRKLASDALSGMRDFVVSWGANMVKMFEDLGRNTILGLMNGIRSEIGNVLGLIGGLGHDISGAFSSVLHMASPSRIFYQHGINTVMGWINAVRAMRPMALAVMRELGGSIATGGIPVTAGGGYGGGVTPGGRVNVTVPVTLNGTMSAFASPEFLQGLQAVVQEAILRYALNNSNNGTALPGRQF